MGDPPDVTASPPSFDFNDFSTAAPGPDGFMMDDNAFANPFDLGILPMDLDISSIPFNWVS